MEGVKAIGPRIVGVGFGILGLVGSSPKLNSSSFWPGVLYNLKNQLRLVFLSVFQGI